MKSLGGIATGVEQSEGAALMAFTDKGDLWAYVSAAGSARDVRGSMPVRG